MKGKSFFLDPDIVLLVALGVFAGAFLAETRSYNPTAALFPRLVSIITLILLVWAIARRCLALLPIVRSSSQTTAKSAPEGTLAWYWTLASMLGYFVLIHILGFIPVSLIYLLVLPVLLGYRRYGVVLITGGLMTASFIAVFTYVLHARIPGGIVWSLLREFLKAS